MELTRRAFTKLVIAGAAGMLGGLYRTARATPVRAWRAARAAAFPGRVRPLDEHSIRRPADWAG